MNKAHDVSLDQLQSAVTREEGENDISKDIFLELLRCRSPILL
uniref:Uncharacterized protein n=1 Tax=Lepeophtheirus salmonis TaxID=72036 RepID=A0A0K2T7L2_LEPSM